MAQKPGGSLTDGSQPPDVEVVAEWRAEQAAANATRKAASKRFMAAREACRKRAEESTLGPSRGVAIGSGARCPEPRSAPARFARSRDLLRRLWQCCQTAAALPIARLRG